jgi:hypothetical protein
VLPEDLIIGISCPRCSRATIGIRSNTVIFLAGCGLLRQGFAQFAAFGEVPRPRHSLQSKLVCWYTIRYAFENLRLVPECPMRSR